MKAKEWIVKFEAVPESSAEERFTDVLKEFCTETTELVNLRTRNSKPESRFSAAEGAVREQKNKFRVICEKIPGLTEGLFDSLLITAVPEYTIWQKAAQKKVEAAEKQQQYGRHLAKKR